LDEALASRSARPTDQPDRRTGRFLATAMLDPADRIVARILSRKRISLDHAWLTRQLLSAIDLRSNHADLGDTNAFRLVNAEGDGLPGLTVDRYAGFLMVQLYCAGWRPHLKLVTRVLQELLAPPRHLRRDPPQNTRELEATASSKRYGKLRRPSRA
jgi:23S rRNA (cytosine1962-C5)-methyltransferase